MIINFKISFFFSAFFFLTICNNFAQSKHSKQDIKEIISVMKKQEKAWSKNDLEGFMEGYWKNDSLKFFGKNGLTEGWTNALNNYKKSYPTKAYTGVLSFRINNISKINNGAYFVMGEFQLKRKLEEAKGVFMVIFKKINGKWKIIADMSC